MCHVEENLFSNLQQIDHLEGDELHLLETDRDSIPTSIVFEKKRYWVVLGFVSCV